MPSRLAYLLVALVGALAYVTLRIALGRSALPVAVPIGILSVGLAARGLRRRDESRV